MKRITVVTVFLAFSAMLFAESFVPSPGSMVRIEGASSQSWKLEGRTINGRIDAGKEPAVTVTIPTASLKSEPAGFEIAFGEIRYELKSADVKESTGPTSIVNTAGSLTIAGVTRNLEMTVSAMKTSDGRYMIAGRAPIRLSEFGIDPSRHGDEIRLTFRWVVRPAGSS